MKLSCLPVSFFTNIISGEMSLGEWAIIAREAGLDAIDLSILFVKAHTPVYLHQARNEIENEGMSIAMITTYPDFSHPDRHQRDRELAYLISDIAVASQLGAKYLRVLAGQAHPETKRDEGIKWAVENLKYSCDTADRFGIKLVYENHAKPGAWDYIDFSHPTDIFLEIVEKTKDVDLKINFDTANTIAYGDDPIPVLEKVIDRIETIHAADTSTRGVLNHCLLGTGLVPFRKMFSILKKSGFDGWICMEEGSNQGIEGVQTAAGFIRKLWNE